MCKELEERKSLQNIDLGFVSYCRQTAQSNLERAMLDAYIEIQMQSAMETGKILEQQDALDKAEQRFWEKKAKGYYDILNRTL